MVSPSGEQMQVSAAEAGTLAGLGYKQLTPEFTAQQAEQAKYGEGIVNELEAAGLGILRGSTLGLSDLALRKINPEWADSAAKLKQYNPDASLAGELGAFALPGLGAIKALGAAGKAAKTAGLLQGLVSSGGAGLGKIATKIVGDNLAGHALGAGINMAAQSAVYQAAHNLSEDALGDRDMTAESILAHTGQAAILGAGIGAALPIVARGTQAIANSAPVRYAVSGAAKQFAKFFDPDRSLQLFTGAMKKELGAETGKRFQTAVSELAHDSGASLYSAGEVALDPLTAKIVKTGSGGLPNQSASYERLQSIKTQAGEAMGETLREADAASAPIRQAAAERFAAERTAAASATAAARERANALARSFGNMDERLAADAAAERLAGVEAALPEKLAGESANLQSKLSSDAMAKIDKWEKTAQVGSAEARGLRGIVSDVAKKIGDPEAGLIDMHQMRMGLDARVGGKNWQKLAGEEIEIVKDMRRAVSAKMDSTLSGLADAGLMAPDALNKWKRLNRLMSNLYTIEKPLEGAIARSEGNVNVMGLRFRDIGIGAVGAGVLGPAGAALGVANKALQTDTGLLARAAIGEKLQKLAWAEQLMGKTQNEISNSVKSFLGGAKADKVAASAVAKFGAPVAYALSTKAEPAARSKSQQSWFDETRQQILSVAGNPEQFAAAQGAQAQPLADAAPGVTDALIGKQLQVYAYLANAMPKNPGMPTNIFTDSWKPADYEVANFRKVVQVARAPLTILKDLRAGTITGAQVEAVKTLYPRLYESILDRVRQEVTAPDMKTTYQQRLKLGQLFQGTEPTMAPEFIAAMQTPATKPEEPKNTVRPPGGSVKLSKNYATSTERAANR